MPPDSQTSKRVLIVGDVGNFDCSDDWLIDRLQPACRGLAPSVQAQAQVHSFDAMGIANELRSGSVAAVVVSAIQGLGDDDAATAFCKDVTWLAALRRWVQQGGQLALMGGAAALLQSATDAYLLKLVLIMSEPW